MITPLAWPFLGGCEGTRTLNPLHAHRCATPALLTRVGVSTQ
jgi:hypothetical protein